MGTQHKNKSYLPKLLKAVALAKKIGAEIRVKRPDNGYGGYNNGSTVVWFNLEKEEVWLITTCRNCGDGNWTKISELIT